MKRTLFVLIALLCLFFSHPVFAEGPGGPGQASAISGTVVVQSGCIYVDCVIDGSSQLFAAANGAELLDLGEIADGDVVVVIVITEGGATVPGIVVIDNVAG